MAVVGTCTTMCPKKESGLRCRMKRLTPFETVGGKPALNLCVKEYARCAAGSRRSPEEVRTPETLLKTTHYLSRWNSISLLNYIQVAWLVQFYFSNFNFCNPT